MSALIVPGRIPIPNQLGATVGTRLGMGDAYDHRGPFSVLVTIGHRSVANRHKKGMVSRRRSGRSSGIRSKRSGRDRGRIATGHDCPDRRCQGIDLLAGVPPPDRHRQAALPELDRIQSGSRRPQGLDDPIRRESGGPR